MSEVRQFSCNLCEALCGLDVTLENGRVTDVRGDPLDVFSGGHICPKAVGMRELYDDPSRLRAPMRRTASGWVKVSWKEALDEAGSRLGEIQRKHGRDAVALYFGNPSVHTHSSALGTQLLQLALRTKNTFN